MGRNNRRRDRFTKRLLEWALRPLFRRPRLSADQILAETPRRVLIVRQHNQMGDMLCTTPAFRAIRHAFPEAHLTLVTAPINDGVVRNNPDLDRIVLFDKRRPWAELWRFVRDLRAQKPDLAIVLNTVSYSSTSSWIAVLSGARHIVGGTSEPFGWTFSRWLYNLELPAQPGAPGHAIDHALRSLTAMGIEARSRQPVLVPGEDAEAKARDFLQTVGPAPRAAVHPGAGKVENRWSAAGFVAAIQALESWGATVYLVEGPADRAATDATLEALGSPRPVLRGADLLTVAAALAASEVALVNDTGVMHVAGAVGVPTVAMFGPTPRAEWQPPSPELVAVQSSDGAMSSILPEAVLPLLRERFERGRARATSLSR